MLTTLLLSLGLLATTHAIPHVNTSPITSEISKRGLAPGYGVTSVFLQASGQPTLCLGTTETPANDVFLYFIPCDTTVTWWGAWEIAPGENADGITLSGTNFCLDAGLNPHNGGPSKLYTCLPGVPQQNWYYTPDQHIAITGGTQCLDATGGGCGLGGCAPGTEACGTGNVNSQTWLTAPIPPAPTTGLQINWNGNSSRCLTPSVRAPSDGTLLFEGGCLHQSDAFSQLQLFDIQRGSGQVKLHGTNLCLDAGSNPGNGIQAKLWTCYPGLFQQTWYYTNDNHIAITGGNQCLDLRKEDGFTVQTWQCSGGDPQQLWTTGTQT